MHVERDGAQGMQVEVHPSGDQYHLEMQAVQNPLVGILLRVKKENEDTCGFLALLS